MTKPELHPTLVEILSLPGNPDAVPVEKQTPQMARAEFDSDIAAVDGPAPDMADIKDIIIPGPASELPARIYTANGDAGTAVFVYLHGGGNIRGNIGTHDSTCRVLADAGKCAVVSIDYRLAPEHPFPAAFDDAVAATRWLAENTHNFGWNGRRFIVAGDSAGGNLAAAVAHQARDDGAPKIDAQLLIYPVIDHVGETESKRLFSKGFMLDSMPFYTASYIPDEADRRDPRASPIYAEDHGRLPPAVILTAGFDPLRDEANAYADALANAGVKVERIVYPDMIHGFTLLRGLLPEADQALSRCARAAIDLATGAGRV